MPPHDAGWYDEGKWYVPYSTVSASVGKEALYWAAGQGATSYALRALASLRGLEPVVIGENMLRVQAASMEAPGTFYAPTSRVLGGYPANAWWMLKNALSGRGIVDIGIDASRSARSWYYRMERAIVWLANGNRMPFK